MACQIWESGMPTHHSVHKTAGSDVPGFRHLLFKACDTKAERECSNRSGQKSFITFNLLKDSHESDNRSPNPPLALMTKTTSFPNCPQFCFIRPVVFL